ncbi:unnamed protein product [Moneuplotes crassus]|uniref:Uncharacterized protein n=1 Tax=Euplotes crassus TaxID=5936 RepID=A0AAD1XMP3_EUPCR|nr:unnamed protein product [Moneuplotes crassus]
MESSPFPNTLSSSSQERIKMTEAHLETKEVNLEVHALEAKTASTNGFYTLDDSNCYLNINTSKYIHRKILKNAQLKFPPCDTMELTFGRKSSSDIIRTMHKIFPKNTETFSFWSHSNNKKTIKVLNIGIFLKEITKISYKITNNIHLFNFQINQKHLRKIFYCSK